MNAAQERQPDILVKSIRWFAAAAWLVLITSLLLVGMARPYVYTFFDRYYDIDVSRGWDRTLLTVNYQIILFLFIICANGLFINSRRHKRKEDRYNKSLIFIGLASIVALAAYHLFF